MGLVDEKLGELGGRFTRTGDHLDGRITRMDARMDHLGTQMDDRIGEVRTEFRATAEALKGDLLASETRIMQAIATLAE